MESKPVTLGSVGISRERIGGLTNPANRPDREQPTMRGFAASYIRLCKGQGRRITTSLQPLAGDWLLRQDGELELTGDPPRPLTAGELVVPRLDRLLQLLKEQVNSLVLDGHEEDYACLAFDDEGRSLANIVSRNPEEAIMRALLFILAERAANEASG